MCSFPGCEADARAKGLCSGHYRQQHLGKPMTPIDRLPRPAGCQVVGCGRKVHGEGLCNMHYLRRQRTGDTKASQPPRAFPSAEERLWAKVDKGGPGDCWLWTGVVNLYGYGSLGVKNSRVLVHRLAYELQVGPIPKGLCIDHLCRNRRCVNPRHMEVVTRGENSRRGWLRKTHCKYGHEWTEENTLRTKRGTRLCRQCNKRNCAERYAKSKVA